MTNRDFLFRILTIGASLVIAAGVWYLRQIFLMVFLAAIIAIALNIPVKNLQRIGFGRGIAIVLTVLGTVYLIIGVSAGVVPETVVQIRDLADDLPSAMEEAANAYEGWRQDNDALRDVLPEMDYEKLRDQITSGDNAEDPSEEVTASDDGGSLSDSIDIGAISSFVLPMLGDVGNFVAATIANILILFFVSIFFLVDPMDYLRGSVMLVPESYQGRFLEVISELRSAILAWLLSVGIAMLVTSISIYVGMGLMLHIPNAKGIAIIAAASTIIPNIGSLIPFIPIIIFTLADDPAKLLVAIPMYIMIQQVEANVITPQVVERQLAIPAAMTMVFQLISAILFGFLGILLAVPILAVIVTLVRELYVYDALGLRGVSLDIKQDEDGRLYALEAKTEEDVVIIPTMLKIRLELEPLVQRLRAG
jgi:predicted PurR-regulated permease PerM